MIDAPSEPGAAPERQGDRPGPIMSIHDAPMRIRRDYHRRERRNSIIAILVIACVLGLLGWALLRALA